MTGKHNFTTLTVLAVCAVCVLCGPAWWLFSGAADEHTHQREATQPRSPKWAAVRDEYVRLHPECAACGSTGRPGKPLQAHHIIPFSVDANGDVDNDGVPNELDPDNLITLCVDGVGHCDCHLLIGHAGNFRCRNENVVRDARRFRKMLHNKVCNP